MFKGQATMLSTALFLALAVPATAQITPDPATPDEQPRSEDCLLPPDDGVAEAEPDSGVTPIIPPGELPEQPPSQE